RNNALTVQGDLYAGEEGTPSDARVNGQNLSARWSRTFSRDSDLALQVYVDRTWRRLPMQGFRDELMTCDLDFQHRFPVLEGNSLIWGVGYRLMQNWIVNSGPLAFIQPALTMHLFRAFVQD